MLHLTLSLQKKKNRQKDIKIWDIRLNNHPKIIN